MTSRYIYNNDRLTEAALAYSKDDNEVIEPVVNEVENNNNPNNTPNENNNNPNNTPNKNINNNFNFNFNELGNTFNANINNINSNDALKILASNMLLNTNNTVGNKNINHSNNTSFAQQVERVPKGIPYGLSTGGQPTNINCNLDISYLFSELTKNAASLAGICQHISNQFMNA